MINARVTCHFIIKIQFILSHDVTKWHTRSSHGIEIHKKVCQGQRFYLMAKDQGEYTHLVNMEEILCWKIIFFFIRKIMFDVKQPPFYFLRSVTKWYFYYVSTYIIYQKMSIMSLDHPLFLDTGPLFTPFLTHTHTYWISQ